MNTLEKGMFTLAAVALFMGSANATEAQKNLDFNVQGFVGGGLAFGGDTVAEYDVEYYGGDDGSEDVDAGEGLFIYGGARFNFPQSNLSLQLLGGYHSAMVWGEDADVSFSRLVLDLMPFLEFEKVRLGVGLTRHVAVEFEDDGVYDYSVDYDDATGFVIQAEWKINRMFALGVRHTKIDYEPSDKGVYYDYYYYSGGEFEFDREISADSTALIATFTF